jgi:predicted ribosome quality control (RQC) complex YloA/Tae2 family protein
LAKRNKKRLSETTERIQSLESKRQSLQRKLHSIQSALTLSELLELEPKKVEGMKGKARNQIAEFSGKQYRSQEGLIILSGRNLTENLEATFKIARGNDLWFHVKGKPGAHTVVLLPPKRSASLETLLDAAEVCILHSGGKDWGKTEVDYTYRKYVKKIKNQTDVTYTHNKTLSVTPNQERLTRLFSEEQT